MKNVYWIGIMLFLVNNTRALGQSDSDLYLSGYSNNNYYQYFDSLHSVRKGAIQDLNHSYKCYIVFRICANANIDDLEIIEIPEAPLPENVKVYIQDLFFSTNGKWAFKNTLKAFSGDLLFSVSLLKSNQSPEQRIKDVAKIFQFSLSGLQLQKRLMAYNLQNEKSLTLPF